MVWLAVKHRRPDWFVFAGGHSVWRSKLLPRPMVIFGLIGGPLALLAGTGVLLGIWGMHSGLPVAMTTPEMIWEFSLSVWLLIRGFRPLTGKLATSATIR